MTQRVQNRTTASEALPADRLRTLNEISRVVSSTLDLRTLYDTIYEQIGRVMDASQFFIALHRDTSEVIQVPYLQEESRLMLDETFRYGDNTTSVIVEQGMTLLYRTLEEYLQFERANGLTSVIVGDKVSESGIFVPLNTGSRTIGALSVQTMQPRAYSEDDVQTLSVIASQAAVAIENAHLFSELRDRVVELQELEKALRASAEQHRSITETAPDALITIDDTSRIVATNPAAERIFGYSRDEMVGNKLTMLMPKSLRQRHQTGFNRYVRTGEKRIAWTGVELVGVHKNGTEIPLEVSFTEFVHQGRPRFTGFLRDITERKRAGEALVHQALHDALTELPNRALLHDRLEQALLSAERDKRCCSLLLLDLDRFKEINDTFGHHYGDALLQQVAMRLVGALRESDTVARLGGDEFALVLPRATEADAMLVAKKILDALAEPVHVHEQTLHIDASIGIALYPEHGQDATGLLRRADVAMYVAKRTGTQFAVYEAGQDQQTQRRILLVGALRQAIEHDQLRVHYQPKVDCKTGHVAGVETLVRWQHPVHGLVRPDEFIPLAEHTGLIKSLTHWVVNEALRQCSLWRAQGLDVPVEVNLSARTLHDRDLPCMITGLLQSWNGSPSWLGVEITESAVMADADRALEVLSRLDDMGIAISIDDFGTGYSSLAYLRRFPVAEIKIDRSFVTDMIEDSNDRSIVKATISLAHDLDLKVVAEGVETREVQALLDELGCDLLQGYHVCRPRPAENLTRWLKDRQKPVSERRLA